MKNTFFLFIICSLFPILSAHSNGGFHSFLDDIPKHFRASGSREVLENGSWRSYDFDLRIRKNDFITRPSDFQVSWEYNFSGRREFTQAYYQAFSHNLVLRPTKWAAALPLYNLNLGLQDLCYTAIEYRPLMGTSLHIRDCWTFETRRRMSFQRQVYLDNGPLVLVENWMAH